MADRVFCIDFGSAYTKVALRRDPGADGELITKRSRSSSEADFCFHSAVAVDRRGSKAVPEFGDRAAAITSGGGIDVYRNWKKSIFLPSSFPAKANQSPLEELLQSVELRDLANKYGVAISQLANLQQLVTASRNLIAGPTGRVYSAEAQHQTIAASLAPHFFIWLRQQVLESCSQLPTTGLKYESIPVRITIPAFDQIKTAESNPGWMILVDALGKAGWPLHPDNPTTPEPYANAIGILTKGINSFQRGQVRLGDMFGRGPLITVLKDSIHHPVYRAFVIDVGAFTTDFAMLTLNPDGNNSSEPDANIAIAQKSLALGVSDLDVRIVAALPKEKGEWLRKASSMDWEDFRPLVYNEGKGLRVPDLGIVGGPADVEIVRSCVGELAKKIAEEMVQFLDGLNPVPSGSLEELILTGGGSFIPAVREAIQSACQATGRTYSKTHAPALKRIAGGPPVDKLDTTFARGGTALGGASIYFEKTLF